ncbi:MAG: DUF937 domain-containing protein [Chlorobiaceae bacterium]|nr:DUF937 domain-containing protein [Chlorobiaceae bacterium]
MLLITGLKGKPVGKIASLLREESSTVADSLDVGSASVLAGIINKTSSAGGGLELLTTIRAGNLDDTFLNTFSSMLSGGKPSNDHMKAGNAMFSFLFGSKQDQLSKVITAATGLAKTSEPLLIRV